MTKQRYERPALNKLESDMPSKAGTKTTYKPMTHIDGVAVKDLIENYGSPLFVISEMGGIYSIGTDGYIAHNYNT